MSDRHLLVIEDDEDLARTLRRSFERRGYVVSHAIDPGELDAFLDSPPDAGLPHFALVDLKLGTESGLGCVKVLSERSPETVVVVLTGYASIATAVEAIKLGASNYLPKPANSDEIEAAFGKTEADASISLPPQTTQSVKTVEWELIHETLAATGFNISETARRLGMHRRTLARKLEKRRIK